MKKKIVSMLSVLCLGVAWAGAMDWNDYYENPDYAPSSMHQGYYSVNEVNTVSIDQYMPPIYVLSVNHFNVAPNGTKDYAGRVVYKLNYQTKEVWMLDFETPKWQPISVANEVGKTSINRIFQKAYGIPFIE